MSQNKEPIITMEKIRQAGILDSRSSSNDSINRDNIKLKKFPLSLKQLQLLTPYAPILVGIHLLHNAWLAILIYHAIILALLLPHKNRSAFKKLLQGWKILPGAGLILFGLGAGGLLYFLGPLAGINATFVQPLLERLGLAGNNFLYFALYHATINPWLEEAFWRGHWGNKSRKVVLSDIMFAGYHLLVVMLFMSWAWCGLAFAVLILAAWFWRQMATKYNGLLVPTLSHMVADGSIMMAVLAIIWKG